VKARIAIGMPTGRTDQIDCHQHPGTREQTLGYRIAQAHIDEAVGIKASDIAHSREAVLQRDAGMDRGLVSFLCDVMPEAIDKELVIGFHSDCQMRVRVDEAGAQRDIAEIDPIGAGRDSQVGSACGDLFSLDQDHATCLDPIRFAVEDSRSFESDSHFDIDLTYTTLQQWRQRSPRD
jgi:hypothetical protein